MVRLQPYWQLCLQYWLHHKLSARYFSPVQVTTLISPVVYEVDLLVDSKIHRVFHVSKIKRFKGDLRALVVLPEAIATNWVAVIPEAMLGSQFVLKNNIPQVELLVQWEGEHPHEMWWEFLEAMAAVFQSLDLVDKVDSNGLGDDTGIL